LTVPVVRIVPTPCEFCSPRKEKGAGVNASPSLVTLDSGAQAPPIQKRR
jgi:hypothetical protein